LTFVRLSPRRVPVGLECGRMIAGVCCSRSFDLDALSRPGGGAEGVADPAEDSLPVCRAVKGPRRRRQHRGKGGEWPEVSIGIES
jgi:hypothetical protein